ncbi:MAG: hypothetical protein AAGA01_07545 [Cyanobacteria bacterium P01_E01_bin.43]
MAADGVAGNNRGREPDRRRRHMLMSQLIGQFTLTHWSLDRNRLDDVANLPTTPLFRGAVAQT